MKDVCDNVKKEGGERIALTEATTALDPMARLTIQEDRSLRGSVNSRDAVPPFFGKAFGKKDTVESIPADRVKSFAKASLKTIDGAEHL